MRASQQIFKVRRKYNQWVADQTLEDYALRFTAIEARRFSASMVATTALGATAFLALEAIGAAITLNYGVVNTIAAILSVALVIVLTGSPICYYAAKHGLDIDLLTRGAGFGYLGSTITSLIYASFTFIFFAIEAAILAVALQALFAIPLEIGYIICAIAVIPIVTHGITWISRFQMGTQPIWLALQVIAIASVLYLEWPKLLDWLQFKGNSQVALNSTTNSAFNLSLFGAASAVLFAMVAQIGEQVDYLRFLPEQKTIGKSKWWTALLLAGPGWIVPGIIKMLFGSFLAWLAIQQAIPNDIAADPTYMYTMAFSYISESPTLALALAGIMVIISQMKINVTNAYAGSIAWSNFFSRLTHSHPGRVVWLFFNVAIALLLMELGIYRALENVLGVFAIIAVSWLGCLSADLLINKKLGLSPKHVEFKRAHLYDINPVGMGSMIIASVLGVIFYLGTFGPTAQALAHYLTLLITYISVPSIALLTKSKYYIARSSSLDKAHSHYACTICENHFEYEDMTFCPAYDGPICSLCCSLDGRCLDNCKPDENFSSQVTAFIAKLLPEKFHRAISPQLAYFLGSLVLIASVSAAIFSLVYYHLSAQNPGHSDLLQELLITMFFILLIIFGILSWLFLLAQQSRLVAQEESNRQTLRLIDEIEAHKITDLALQKSKEDADAANLAKSRYLSGISHELRTPLQTILGYAQILSRDSRIPEERLESIEILRRSGEYLADLIEGLLDISKIEAGKLEIYQTQVDLHALLKQIGTMFRLQAAAKNIDFISTISPHIPKYVNADEKRLRQILINLLANAIKFTEQGQVNFSVRYRNQVAEFIIEDTGEGISDEHQERIFKPFERIKSASTQHKPGTGLGLTIVKLLCDIMGGDISVESTTGQGAKFTVRLMLPSIDKPSQPVNEESLIQTQPDEQGTIMVVDDEPSHRSLIFDFLVPLGFNVLEAKNANSCLSHKQLSHVDLFLLDVSLPDINGLTLAKKLRDLSILKPIIMVSADAEEHHSANGIETAHDAYLVKPIKLTSLQDILSHHLYLQWPKFEPQKLLSSKAPSTSSEIPTEIPKHQAIEELLSYAELGYAKGFRKKLSQLKQDPSFPQAFSDQLEELARAMRYPEIVSLLTSDKEVSL